MRPADPAWAIRAQPWRRAEAPATILAIRLQAIGDVAITLPYLRALQKSLPDTEIDMVTREETGGLPRAVDLFRHVDELGGGRHERYQVLLAVLMAARLRARRYDVVLDLQNNRVSRTIRRAILPRAWSTFDRWSPNSAGERTRRTIEAAGFPLPLVEASLPLKNPELGLDVLRHADWDSSRELVVFSPAGAFPTRNWPIEHYARFAELWRQRRPVQFAVMGLDASRDKAAALSAALGSDLLDLVGRTTLSEALAIVQRARLVLTEDCGLMHMAWVSGVPTLALFGSSRHDWSAPLGAHSLCLHSGDLPCGACMERTCRFGDVHCLTRYSPEYLVREAEGLIARAKGRRAIVTGSVRSYVPFATGGPAPGAGVVLGKE
jgi:heptosyltransferase-2